MKGQHTTCQNRIRRTRTHRLLIPKDLPHIEELPRHLSDGPALQSDRRTTIKPITLQIQLNLLPVRRIREMDTALAATKRKVPFHLKAVALRAFAHETLLDGEHLLLDGEELVALQVGERLGAVQREDFAFAFADGRAGGGGDGEVVAGEGEHFLFHLEGCGFGGVEGWVGGLRA